MSIPQHDNVVQVIHWEQTDTTLYVVMEYVSGGNLGELVRAKPPTPLPMAEARRFAANVACGLAHVHKHHVGHRDLKGDNVLVRADGSACLADFGSSARLKMLNETVLASVQGQPGAKSQFETMAGTPLWMAPEIIWASGGDGGGHGYGLSADIWSYGCLVAEVIDKGQPPWPPFPSSWAALLHIGGPTAVPIAPPHAPEEAKELLAKCWRRDAKERIVAADLLADPYLAPAAPPPDAVPLYTPPEDDRSKSQHRPTLQSSATVPTFPLTRAPLPHVSAAPTTPFGVAAKREGAGISPPHRPTSGLSGSSTTKAGGSPMKRGARSPGPVAESSHALPRGSRSPGPMSSPPLAPAAAQRAATRSQPFIPAGIQQAQRGSALFPGGSPPGTLSSLDGSEDVWLPAPTDPIPPSMEPSSTGVSASPRQVSTKVSIRPTRRSTMSRLTAGKNTSGTSGRQAGAFSASGTPVKGHMASGFQRDITTVADDDEDLTLAA